MAEGISVSGRVILPNLPVLPMKAREFAEPLSKLAPKQVLRIRINNNRGEIIE
jgi:hypothetical protein